MKRTLSALTSALEYIEQNLCEPITREDIAAHCAVSLSMLEKLFRYALHCSIKEYMTKRRVTQAAHDLLHTDLRVIDIAMKYQYNSPEVFCRAFQRVWNTRPSQFKARWRFAGIFPRRAYEYREGEDMDVARKRVDITEAYSFFKERRGTYVICADIRELIPINNLSRKAGDLAILETAMRLDRVATDDMLVLRVGGDEFALITGLSDLQAVVELQSSLAAMNGQTFEFEGKAIPLSLWLGLTVIPDDSLRFRDFFEEMHRTITDSKA